MVGWGWGGWGGGWGGVGGWHPVPEWGGASQQGEGHYPPVRWWPARRLHPRWDATQPRRLLPSRYVQWSCTTPTMLFTLSKISNLTRIEVC